MAYFHCESITPVSWHFEGTQIDFYKNTPYRIKGDGILISNANYEHRGYYECHGTTEHLHFFKARGLLKIKSMSLAKKIQYYTYTCMCIILVFERMLLKYLANSLLKSLLIGYSINIAKFNILSTGH